MIQGTSNFAIFVDHTILKTLWAMRTFEKGANE